MLESQYIVKRGLILIACKLLNLNCIEHGSIWALAIKFILFPSYRAMHFSAID